MLRNKLTANAPFYLLTPHILCLLYIQKINISITNSVSRSLIIPLSSSTFSCLLSSFTTCFLNLAVNRDSSGYHLFWKSSMVEKGWVITWHALIWMLSLLISLSLMLDQEKKKKKHSHLQVAFFLKQGGTVYVGRKINLWAALWTCWEWRGVGEERLGFWRFYQLLPGSSDHTESTCNAGDLGSIPGLGRLSGERNGNPFQYSCLENSMDRGAFWATVHGITQELDMTEQLVPIALWC